VIARARTRRTDAAARRALVNPVGVFDFLEPIRSVAKRRPEPDIHGLVAK
jgi:hypothetical protein